jgi:hypothetical protein
VIPFNLGALAPFMPSVFNGPYNAQGAEQNEQTIAAKYPWITPPAGQFAGAQPGQFAGATAGPDVGGFPNGFGGTSGFTPPAAPNPPIPPTVPQGGSPGGSQMNPQSLATGQVNAMQPNSLQSILAVLGAQNPTTAGA